MTKINKLVLHGFKSFAKFTEIQFGDKYNCVIGPNGSGKSNILDALTFVLGKAGAKSMRAEKSSNLIYNGGKSKKAGAKGEVSIFFDNKDKTFPTEEQEVKVTRIIRQNGQSIYKINDEVRTRQQIVDLLHIARIDPDGYNLILQGDIVRFCEMSTTERRLLIEEIAGISVYEEKKQKAVGQLQKVEERLKEAEIILAERKTYLKELQKDRDQALKFKELSENVRIYKASLIKLQMDKREAEAGDLKKRVDEQLALVKEAEERIAKFREQIAKKKGEIEALTKEVEEKGETDQVNLNREIEDMKVEMARRTSRLELTEQEVKRVSGREKETTGTLEELTKKVEDIGAQKAELETRRKERQKERELIEKKIKAFREKNNLEQAGEIEKNVEESDKKIDELAKDINQMRETQHNLLREKDAADRELGLIVDAMAKVSLLEKEHKQQLDGIKQKRESFKASALELNKVLDEDSKLSAKIGESRQLLTESQEQLAKLQARQASIREFSQSDRAIKEILDRKTKGVYGTVSELGTVEAKYALALEVAAGIKIKSIVVDDEKLAQQQIEHLRRTQSGIATFVPLTTIRSKHLSDSAKKLITAKGCLGPATKFVKFDPQFRPVFESVFGDVLVVESLDVARRFGIGEAKMVTLDGDFADVSGTMKGGYHAKKRQGMGFKEAQLDKELEAFTASVAEAEGALSVFQSRREELEKKMTELRTRKAELEGEIIREEKSLHLDAGDASLSKSKEQEIQDRAKNLEKKINELQDSLLEKNRELAKYKTEKQMLRDQISHLRSPMLIAELAAYEEKGRQLVQEVTQLDAELRNAQVQVSDLFAPEMEKTRSQLVQLKKEQQGFEKEQQELKKDIDKRKAVLAKKEEEARAFYQKFKELFNQRSILATDINKLDLDIVRQNEKSREAEIKNNTLSIKNAEILAGLAGLREEFSQYEGVTLDTEKSEEQLKYQLVRFEKMKEEIGSVNMRALEIYEQIAQEHAKLVEKKDTLAKEKADVEALMAEIEGRKKELFMRTFDSLNREFQKIFSTLSKKGQAELELENKEDPFAEGVWIKVRIAGQKFLDIRSLSGGEKTMTALAFIFAIQEHDPASFYILDEVDAALDKHNAEKLAKLIHGYSDRAQYILISHNDGVIGEAHNLYGISMDEDGVSKVVSLKV
ncbi:MAG: chromosome segregation protein SMC [Nanoarchaeota archaeon]|nr:chromosome segregation protein SMC [Nanoarchaeota archaeon]